MLRRTLLSVSSCAVPLVAGALVAGCEKTGASGCRAVAAPAPAEVDVQADDLPVRYLPKYREYGIDYRRR